MNSIFVVVVKRDIGKKIVSKNLKASFDKKAMNDYANEMKAKNPGEIEYVVDEVKFIAEEISEDDF